MIEFTYLPDYVYKFRSFDSAFSLTTLRKNKIFFAGVESLNDPFEMKANMFYGQNPFEESFAYQVTRGTPHAEVIKQLEKGVIPIALQNGFCEYFSKSYYVFSVSEIGNGVGFNNLDQQFLTSEDIMLFSHYSNGHTGYCLEIRTKDLPVKVQENMRMVKYRDIYPTVDMSLPEIDLRQSITKILATKNKNWSYEREYRSLINNQDEIGNKINNGILVDIPEKAITSIILGCKVNEENKNIICEIAKKRSINVYETNVNSVRYELNIKASSR